MMCLGSEAVVISFSFFFSEAEAAEAVEAKDEAAVGVWDFFSGVGVFFLGVEAALAVEADKDIAASEAE